MTDKTIPNKNLLSRFGPLPTNDSYFISFEGIEGSGKTTQIKILQEDLLAQGYEVSVFREPGGTQFGEKLREAILNSTEKVAPLAEACLFAASRAQLLETKTLPLLKKKGQAVIVDRYLDSSLAYQGLARGLGVDAILELHQRFPLNITPHLSFYLKIDLETSMERQRQRGEKKDYFEKETKEFYQKLIEGYDQASQLFKTRFLVIDAKASPQAVAGEIKAGVAKMTGN
ncbi:MAG: dTMP kinase [Bacteriovoracaceae bacterium]